MSIKDPHSISVEDLLPKPASTADPLSAALKKTAEGKELLSKAGKSDRSISPKFKQ